MFRPVGKPRVAEEIVQQLRGLILRGEYAVGDKLPPERKLAEELGVNRASLREAIKSLEHLGLVKTRQGDGTRVLDFMQTAGVELVSHLISGAGAPTVEGPADVPVDLSELLKLDFEFYVAMTRAAHNRVMQLLINTMRSAVLSYAPFFAQ